VTTPAPPATLADWLLACLADDEAVALAAQEHPGTSQAERWVSEPVSDFAGRRRVVRHDHTPHMQPVAIQISGPRARHIARQDPAATLARIKAVRAVVELHDGDADPSDCTPWGRRYGEPCDTLRALAQMYAGRDGFREEWAA
jgi:hypothetical protein